MKYECFNVYTLLIIIPFFF